MALWSRNKNQTVASVEVSLFDDQRGIVTFKVDEGDRSQVAYHTILHFVMYYSRLLYFLSYRPTGEELVSFMDEAVRALAGADESAPVSVSGNWTLLAEAAGEPLSVWFSELVLVAPKKYRIKQVKPKDPEDEHAQGVALLFLQHLVNTLGPLERAHLALSIAGMHEYYATIKHWGNSKSLHAGLMHGMAYAQRTLRGK